MASRAINADGYGWDAIVLNTPFHLSLLFPAHCSVCLWCMRWWRKIADTQWSFSLLAEGQLWGCQDVSVIAGVFFADAALLHWSECWHDFKALFSGYLKAMLGFCLQIIKVSVWVKKAAAVPCVGLCSCSSAVCSSRWRPGDGGSSRNESAWRSEGPHA